MRAKCRLVSMKVGKSQRWMVGEGMVDERIAMRQ